MCKKQRQIDRERERESMVGVEKAKDRQHVKQINKKEDEGNYSFDKQ